MKRTTNNKLLPYLEDTGLDGKKLYTPKEWTERTGHYTKRIDIKPALSGETIPTNNGWRERIKRQDFICVAGPSAKEIITKGDFNTDPDMISREKLIQLFKD